MSTMQTKSKRYLLFMGCDPYPEGGWSDFMGAFESPREVKECMDEHTHLDWAQVVDLTTMRCVCNASAYKTRGWKTRDAFGDIERVR